MNNKHTRRRFLEITGLGGMGLCLQQTLLAGDAFAQTAGPPNYLLMVYFTGGWDQLLALDPRDQRQSQYKFSGTARPTSGIYPAYAENGAADPVVQAVLNASTGTLGAGSGVQRPAGSSATFGPAVPASMLAHAADLSIVRGISMDTLTHEVGMRFFLTGKFPRGVQPSGSSLNTVVAGQSIGFSDQLDLPNLVLGPESYNETFGAYASPTRVNNATDVLNVLSPQAVTAGTINQATLEAFEQQADSCEGHGYDVSGLVGQFRASQAQARRMTNGAKANLFRFTSAPTADIAQLYDAFGIRLASGVYNSTDIAGPLGRAAIAAQAITQGLSQAVALTVTDSLDDHYDLFGQQSTSQRLGWDAVGKLLAYLKTKPHPYQMGKTYYDYTTLLVFSEFSRTPMINARDGRDHHLTNSCLVKGPGILGGRVFGASSDAGMGAQKWNFMTGALNATSGKLIKPTDVHATLLRSMGLTYNHITNNLPELMRPLLRNP